MYISCVTIKNYRNFKDNQILFYSGLNVIIGHNNAGKTNLIKALQLVFDRTQSRLSIEDFYSGYTDFDTPPIIEISVTISEFVAEVGTVNKAEIEDDKNVIYEWLINENQPYQACLTYRFSLPYKHQSEYHTEVNLLRNEDNSFKAQECFKLIEKKYLRKYISNIFGGDISKEEKANNESLERFDFQFLDAIRDAEKQMFYGNNTILRDVLSYFLDYDLTKGQDFEGLSPESKTELNKREENFSQKSRDLLLHLTGRISKEEILEYSKATGAEKGGKPDFDAELSEQQLLFALRLIVEKMGFKLPIKNNGLGYNNLLFIALILAKMQMERSSFMGDNAKIFPILAIEEPEAHLHPAMQYKFLKFLDHNINTQKQARQAFISTHSTQITSAVDLDSIICLYEDYQGNQRVSYPGRVFSESADDKMSKAYVRRFLDATKSNMLFAERVIFVEGLAEQLLVPCFSAYLGAEEQLLNTHTAIVSVDSTTFKHFLKLFAFNDTAGQYGLNRKAVCITDADPSRKELANDDDTRKAWESCYPFQLDTEPDKYSYKPLAIHATNLKDFAALFPNIKISTPPSGTGKTLEYELAFNNPSCTLLLTESFPSRGKNNRELIQQLMNGVSLPESFEEFVAHSAHEDLKKWLNISSFEETAKKIAFVAASYHRAIEASKGEHAFLLERQLRNNLLKKGDAQMAFVIPGYIAESITFITQ